MCLFLKGNLPKQVPGFLFYTVSPTAPLPQAAREYALSFAFTFFASSAGTNVFLCYGHSDYYFSPNFNGFYIAERHYFYS
jgi:hypothetical protein